MLPTGRSGPPEVSQNWFMSPCRSTTKNCNWRWIWEHHTLSSVSRHTVEQPTPADGDECQTTHLYGGTDQDSGLNPSSCRVSEAKGNTKPPCSLRVWTNLDGPKLVKLNCAEMLNNIHTPPEELQEVLDKHSTVFKDELGLITGTTANIYIEEQAEPRFCRPRTVPYALKEKVNTEIDRLEKSGIIRPIENWI